MPREIIPTERNARTVRLTNTDMELELYRRLQAEIITACRKDVERMVNAGLVQDAGFGLIPDPVGYRSDIVTVRFRKQTDGDHPDTYPVTLTVSINLERPQADNPAFDPEQPEQWDY